jgi:hypothetical protein
MASFLTFLYWILILMRIGIRSAFGLWSGSGSGLSSGFPKMMQIFGNPCGSMFATLPIHPGGTGFEELEISVADPWHFGVDPDPRIHASELMDPDPDPDADPAIFVTDLPKMPAKN